MQSLPVLAGGALPGLLQSALPAATVLLSQLGGQARSLSASRIRAARPTADGAGTAAPCAPTRSARHAAARRRFRRRCGGKLR